MPSSPRRAALSVTLLYAWPLLSSSDAVFISPSAGTGKEKHTGGEKKKPSSRLFISRQHASGALCHAFEEGYFLCHRMISAIFTVRHTTPATTKITAPIHPDMNFSVKYASIIFVTSQNRYRKSTVCLHSA